MRKSRGSALLRFTYPSAGGTPFTVARTYDEQRIAFGDFTGIEIQLFDASKANPPVRDLVEKVAICSPAVRDSVGTVAAGITWTGVTFDGATSVNRPGKTSASSSVYQPIGATGVVIGFRYFVGYQMTSLTVKKGASTLTAGTDYVYNPYDGTIRFIAGTVTAGDTTLTYAAGGWDVSQGVWSDPIVLTNAARTDGGIFPLWRVRTYVRGDLGMVQGQWAALSGNMTDDLNDWYGCGGKDCWDNYAAGDQITTPGSIAPPGTAGSKFQVSAARIKYVLPCYDMAVYGDSTDYGASAIDSMAAECWAAKTAYGNGKYVLSPYNAAVASRVHRNHLGALKYDVYQSGNRPAFVRMKPYTSNNGDSSTFPLQISEMCDMLKICEDVGATPIIETVRPGTAVNTPTSAARHYYNGIIRGMAGNRAIVLDADMICRDPSNIDQLLPAYSSGVADPHINVAGEQAIGAALFHIVDTIVR